MNPARKLATTSTLALLLALAGCTSAEPDAAEPTPVSDEPSTSPTAETPESADPTDLLGYEGKLEPGTYSLAAWGQTDADPLPRAIVEVPEGFWSNGGFVIDAGQEAFEPEEFGTIQVFGADQVLTNPCLRRTAVDVGPTVDDLARALVAARGPSTRPRKATLDGRDAVYLEVFVPPDADLSACTDGTYSLWLARGDVQQHSEPGVVHHVWIVEVDGTRLVAVASLYPDQITTQNQQLLAIAESIRFEPAT